MVDRIHALALAESAGFNRGCHAANARAERTTDYLTRRARSRINRALRVGLALGFAAGVAVGFALASI